MKVSFFEAQNAAYQPKEWFTVPRNRLPEVPKSKASSLFNGVVAGLDSLESRLSAASRGAARSTRMMEHTRWVVVNDRGELLGERGWGTDPILGWGDSSKAWAARCKMGQGSVKLDLYHYPA